jgi:hypothetical protein
MHCSNIESGGFRQEKSTCTKTMADIEILFHSLIKQVTLIFHHDDQSVLSFLRDDAQELVLQLEKTRPNPMATDPLMRSMIANY